MVRESTQTVIWFHDNKTRAFFLEAIIAKFFRVRDARNKDEPNKDE